MKILLYKDLIKTPIQENNEEIIEIKTDQFSYGYHKDKQDLAQQLQNKIMARSTVINKLHAVQQTIAKHNPNWILHVYEGYRTSKIQTQRFLKRMAHICQEKFYTNAEDLYEKIHETVAVPSVAGHPTGGAVDVVILDNTTGIQIDFGSPIYDYSNGLYKSFHPDLTAEQKNNRKILRDAMMQNDFAPFDGEYWHFSYGDQEWATFYNKPFAIYSQK